MLCDTNHTIQTPNILYVMYLYVYIYLYDADRLVVLLVDLPSIPNMSNMRPVDSNIKYILIENNFYNFLFVSQLIVSERYTLYYFSVLSSDKL